MRRSERERRKGFSQFDRLEWPAICMEGAKAAKNRQRRLQVGGRSQGAGQQSTEAWRVACTRSRTGCMEPAMKARMQEPWPRKAGIAAHMADNPDGLAARAPQTSRTATGSRRPGWRKQSERRPGALCRRPLSPRPACPPLCCELTAIFDLAHGGAAHRTRGGAAQSRKVPPL